MAGRLRLFIHNWQQLSSDNWVLQDSDQSSISTILWHLITSHSVHCLLQENDYMVKTDLKDTYFTVPICSSGQKFLRFFWILLPTIRAIIGLLGVYKDLKTSNYLHTQGVRIVAYLDDLLMCQSQAIHIALAIYLLQVLGFVINWEKSDLNPVQKIIYLGFSDWLHSDDNQLSKGKNHEVEERSKFFALLHHSFIHWSGKFHNPSCATSSSTLQKCPDAKDTQVH